MFTTPDGVDSAAQLPPIGPPGAQPNGYFADCNPGQGFPGTRPLAEHFNEQIINNRALLRQARITPVKGDESMLWRAILALSTITANQSFYVTTTGVPTPANPFAGDAFNSLTAVTNFLAAYHIAPGVYVTIQFGAGTFTHASPFVWNHPNGNQISLVGAGVDQTVLSFTSPQGLLLRQNLFQLGGMTIRGNAAVSGAPDDRGIWLQGANTARIQDVKVVQWGSDGLAVDFAAAYILGTLTLENCYGNGVLLLADSAVWGQLGTTIRCINCATAPGAVVAGVNVLGGTVNVDRIETTGGYQGIRSSGTGSTVIARQIAIAEPTQPVGVEANNGGQLIAPVNLVVGGWAATGSQNPYFRAATYGFIRAESALAAPNRANASPAVNTLGNTQAMITTTN